MAKTKRLTGANKAFFLWLPLAVVLAISVLYLSARKQQPATVVDYGCQPAPDQILGEYRPDEKLAIFENQPAFYQMAQLPSLSEPVLGVTTDERWIEVDLSDQKLYAHNGDKIDYTFLVSSGKTGPTPTGEFRIWSKYRYTKMSGGSKENGSYYYLPNVPYTQYFYKSYGLHGTYWHNKFGQPMSHGCVNLATPDAEKLFYWTSPVIDANQNGAVIKADQGTRVVIHE